MPGPLPKPDHLRQRRNKDTRGARLPSEEESAANVVPVLPARDSEGGWHPQVVEWWASIWRSPMASEWLDSDVKGGLYLLAELHQARWMAETPSQLVQASSEIRLQEVRFGLSPIDRSRLRWEVAKGEDAADRTEAKRQRKAAVPKPGDDPRNALKVVG